MKTTYESVTKFSFGEVTTLLKPSNDFQDQMQALDAMLVTAHSSLTVWVIDNTIDPDSKNGRQEEITAMVKDGNRQIAQITVSVPTTENYSRSMFERLVQETILPAVVKAARSYPSTRANQPAGQASDQHLLTDEILPGVLRDTSRVSARQLQTR